MSRLILSVLLGLCVQSTYAGILLDPYIGFGTSKSTLDAASSNFDEDTQTAKFIGSRVGYSFLLLSAGVDYQIMSDDDATQNNLSLFVGVDLPILLRAWAEYHIKSDFNHDDLYEAEFTDGYGLGVGFTGLPFVSLNLEVQTMNYDAKLTSSTPSFELQSAAYIVSVSLPLDL
ncbi:MAG: hypothetical protein N4A33_03310 [Bacteriovoracaceae bacterium]|jgi:hypothetical protein|nr:hypothetical protein [Bacteriovoracaceae bacterium]